MFVYVLILLFSFITAFEYNDLYDNMINLEVDLNNNVNEDIDLLDDLLDDQQNYRFINLEHDFEFFIGQFKYNIICKLVSINTYYT